MTKLEVVVVVAVIVVLLALLLPSLSNAKRHPIGQRCQNNLNQIGLAERIWALDNGEKLPWEVSTNNSGTKEWLEAGLVHRHYQALSNEIASPKVLVCREDTNKIAATNFEDLGKENISYLVGLSARENLPNSIMGGDSCLVAKAQLPSGIHALTADQKLSWDKTYHAGYGAIVLGDGSAHRTTKKELQRLLKNSGLATNWVVLP